MGTRHDGRADAHARINQIFEGQEEARGASNRDELRWFHPHLFTNDGRTGVREKEKYPSSRTLRTGRNMSGLTFVRRPGRDDEWTSQMSASSRTRTLRTLRTGGDQYDELVERFRALQDRFAELVAKFESVMQDNSDAFRTLFNYIRVLESNVPISQLCSLTAVISNFEKSRYSIVYGFLTLFSGYYMYQEVINGNDPIARAVYWKRFRQQLYSHFMEMHQLDAKENESGYITIRVTRTDSIFTHCYSRRLYMVGAGAYDPILPREKPFSAVAPGNFEPVDVENIELSERSTDAVVSDAQLRKMFKFFIPGFIWGFTELKVIIENDDKIIRNIQKDIRKYRWVMEHPDPSDVPKLGTSAINLDRGGEQKSVRFDHGTGLGARVDAYWQNYFSSHKESEVAQGPNIDWMDDSLLKKFDKEEEMRAAEEIKVIEFTYWQPSEVIASVWCHDIPVPAPVADVNSKLLKRKRANNDDEEGPLPEERPSKSSRGSRESTSPRFSLAAGSNDAGKEDDMEYARLAENLLHRDEEVLTQAQRRRALHVEKLQVIRRCLTILLDDDLIEFVVLGETFIHDRFSDTKFCSPAGDLPPEYQTRMEKLDALFRPGESGTDPYAYPQDLTPIELAIDHYLSREAEKGNESSKDFHAIMSYMQNIHPIPLQEST